jgi:hypothetical protein
MTAYGIRESMPESPQVPRDIPVAGMSRWKASGIHLGLSAAIAAALLVLMLTVWYPWPLFEAAGGNRLALLTVAVNVVLGPLLTLIVFRSGKKGMKFDLAFIATVQLAALAYGVYAVFVARPAYLVFTIDRFNLVPAVALDPADLAKVKDKRFKSPPVGGPQYVAAVFPPDPAERMKILITALAGKDLNLYPQYYVPYKQEARDALKRAKPLGVLLKRYPTAIGNYLKSSGRPEQSVKYLPLRARSRNGVVLLDSVSGMPLKILLLNPW